MNSPREDLMEQYGTADVFRDKLAGLSPLVERLGMGFLNYGLAEHRQSEAAQQEQQAALMNEAIREYELAQMRQATAPMTERARLEAIAQGVGQDFAKAAGIGDFASFAKNIGNSMKQFGQNALSSIPKVAPASATSSAPSKLLGPLGWKGNALLLGGTVGASILAGKMLHKAPEVMAREAPPAVYGPGRYGYQLPYGTNQYGQPQMGTPL